MPPPYRDPASSGQRAPAARIYPLSWSNVPLAGRCDGTPLPWSGHLYRQRVTGDLEVRYADGDEVYLTFSGEIEHPAAGEVSFVDDSGRAHARRWTNRQSGWSAVRDSTVDVLIVAEALHPSAAEDIADLTATLAAEIGALWSVNASGVLTSASPTFRWG